MTYANQVRLLTMNIQSLASVIGQGLIAAVLPGIQALNALMSKLMQAAETFRNFMYVLMGKKIKGSTSGVVNDLAGLEDSAADLIGLQDAGDAAASGLDDATSSAKALKKALSVLPFDELNQLTDNSSSSGSTLGTGTSKTGTGTTTPSLGLGGITNQIDDALNKEETPINKWAEKIRKAFLNHDWEGLGKTIADMLNIGIRKIYDVISWSNVGPKITAFCDAFTRSFNSLVENIHWDRLGRTVGAGINTLVNTFELLIGPGGIDFVNIGNKLATGLRGMIDEVNWPNLGQVLGSGFMISWNILDGFVQKMSKENNAGLTGWEQLGTAVSDAMNGAFSRISFSKIANTIATGLNGAFQTLSAWTKNFNWDGLVNNISSGINTFIGKFKWKENGTSLNAFITNLLDALVDIAGKTDWEAFGEGIGTFLSQIDWGAHLKKLATVLLDVLSGIWKGLGSTSAGKFVDAVIFGIVGFKAFSKIAPFVDGIVKFCTGSTVEDKLSKGMQKLLGKTVESAAENSGSLFGSLAGKAGTLATKLSSLATAIAPLVGTAGLIVGIGAAATAGVKGLQSLIEKMQGGNGIATEYGNAINTLITQLSNSGAITEDEASKLFKLSESMESSGTSASDAYAKIAEKLGTYGVTSDQAQQALARLSQQQSITSDSLSGLQTAMEGLGNSVSNTSYKIDASKLSYDGLEESIKLMSVQLGLTSDQYTALDTVIMNGENTKATAKQTYDNLIATLKDMGVNTQTAAKIIGQVMPEALVQASNTANTSGKSIKSSISGNAKSAAESANKSLDSIKNKSDSVLPSVATAASTAFGKVNTEATTKWGNSSREVTKNVRQMKIDASTELGKMDTTVRSHFGSQYRIALGKWQNLGRDISSYIRGTMNSSIGGAINGIVNTISRNFGNMYSIGQTAMQNLRNGIESIHINTPHISMDYTDWQEGRTHKWRWNSSVNWYAKGGLFNAASVIGVGEAGKEAVLPLTNKQAMKNIADSITGNMPDGSVGLSKEEMTQAVTQGVAMAMMNMNTGGNSSPQYISNTINLDGRAIAKAVTKAQNDNNRRKNPSPAW